MEFTPTDQFVVETPENIRFGYDVADIGSRFLAVLLDSLIQGVLYILLLLAIVIITQQLARIELPDWAAQLLAVLLILVLFMIQFGYFLFFELVMNGQTPGKRLLHLRVIKENGYPLAPLDAIIRNMVRVIDFFPFAYGVGVIVMFFNKRAKRLGDFAAGTLVVKMRDQVKLQQLATTSQALKPTAAPLLADAHRLDENDIELAETFLQRRAQMSDPAPLTVQIAQRLAKKMARADVPVTPTAALTFLQDVVNAYRAPRGS